MRRRRAGDSREIASVCLLLRHFIHVTDNFCHLFCPFSQVVPWSSPAAPDFLSLLSPVSSLFCSVVLSLLSSLLSSLFPLLVSRWIPSSIPRVLSYCLLALLSPCPSPLSALPPSLLSVFSLLSPLPAPRVTVLAAHRACQHDRFPSEKQRETNPCSAERPCGADTSQRSGREATDNTLRCARREAAAAAAAAAGQQWYAGRQQKHVAGAQIPVARGYKLR